MYAVLTAVETGINQITNVDFGADYKKQANTAWGQGKYLQSVLYSIDGLIESAIDVVLAPTAIVTSTVDNFFQNTLGLGLDEMAMTLQANGLLQAAGETLYYATQWAKTTAAVTGNSKIISKVTKISKRADFYVKPNGEAVPSTGYRYVSKNAEYLPNLYDTMKIPSNNSGTYFSFNKFDNPSPGKLQVPHDASIRLEFDTLQIIDDIKIPYGKWGTSDYLEPITNDFGIFGPGGATQAITNKSINLEKIELLTN